MIQTRYMKKNNINMNDIQTRNFYINNYKNIKKVKTNVIILAKEKINYIFNSYKKEVDFGPFYYQFSGQLYRYITNTICLNHLIEFHNFDRNIDYISIDTEGNELNIIKKFNFKKYSVNFFTIEHNFNNESRKKI